MCKLNEFQGNVLGNLREIRFSQKEGQTLLLKCNGSGNCVGGSVILTDVTYAENGKM